MQNYTALEYYAGLAMQALIAKLPLLDKKGTIGTNPEEDLAEIKSDVAKSAWEYAQYMVLHSGEAKTWAENNVMQKAEMSNGTGSTQNNG